MPATVGSNKEKFETLRNLFLTIEPNVKGVNVINFPTYEELLEKAKKQSDEEECQLSFMLGYLNGVELLFENISKSNFIPRFQRK